MKLPVVTKRIWTFLHQTVPSQLRGVWLKLKEIRQLEKTHKKANSWTKTLKKIATNPRGKKTTVPCEIIITVDSLSEQHSR